MTASTEKSLIIGIGNPLRGDDALGPIVVDQLEPHIDQRFVQVIARHQLTLDLVSELAGFDRVIFIDAAIDGPPGEIVCREIEPRNAGQPTSHSLDAPTLLVLTELLFGRCPTAHLITIRGESFELADNSLSPNLADKLDDLLWFIIEFIEHRRGLVHTGDDQSRWV